MKSRLVVAVLVCVVLASGVWAQGIVGISPRASGMGGAGIGVADDAVAWSQNPAGLAALNVPCKEGQEYGNDALFGYASTGDTSGWGISWSGWKPSDNIGFGAGYADAEDTGSVFGAGFGAGLKDVPLSAGINVMALHADVPSTLEEAQIGGVDNDQTILNLGLMYRISQGEGKAPVRLGLTVTDLTDQFDVGPWWNLGIGWMAAKDLLVAVDVTDLTGESGDAAFSGGVEYSFGEKKEWRGRAGLMDTGGGHDFTLGAGYQAKQWRADFAYVATDPDAVWTIGIGLNL